MTPGRPMRIALLILVLCSSALALSPPPSSRRSFLSATTLVGTWGLAKPACHALQERNEALCGTGFFTNIWQYKCTDLGDIEDEGMAKDLSDEDQGTVDSLMAKLNLESDKMNVAVEEPSREPKD
jgi:hypothetical protein